MKRLILICLSFLVQIADVQGLDVQARAAGIIPQDKNIWSVYGHGLLVDYELEASVRLDCIASCWASNWDAWLNLSYCKKHGHSEVETVSSAAFPTPQALDAATLHELHNNKVSDKELRKKSIMTNYALNVGLKYCFWSECCFNPYLGFGLGACHVCYRDHSIFVKQEIDSWGVCLLAKSGIKYEFAWNLFFDLFADYSFNWYGHPHSKHEISTRGTNSGGFKLGLGLGYHF
jgi:hypothetical protein